MLRKRRFKKDNLVKVTFIADDRDAERVFLAGEFNDWQAAPMRRDPNGSWRSTVDLEPDREYQFRYLVDGNRWINDPEADGFTPNPFGAENSVVRT